MSGSAIYEGTVVHRRLEVRRHEFRYRLALAYIDLDELPTLLDGRLLRPRPGCVRFRRRDYFGDPATPLAEAVRHHVAAQTGTRPGGPIRLLTQLRSFGHCFNPVSFYYCFGSDGERLEAVLAEITNTPWGERHAYVLAPACHSRERGFGGEVAKQLHVSPFLGMDHRYAWRLRPPADSLAVEIESRREGELAFVAALHMKRLPLTRKSLNRMTRRYPGGTVRVLALIYSQALRLRMKGVPMHPHPGSVGR
ncbi:MAG TPA: DUF1365 domain-containing protein [Solirubrobacteraceae bacterium]